MSRKSCYKCSFSSLPRTGDITIGDFWNIDRYDKNLDDRKGTSLILPNNSKADIFLKDIINHNKNIILYKEIPLNFIKNTCNGGLFEKRNMKIDNREIFFKKLKLFYFNKVVSHFFDDKADVGLVGFNGNTNYGSILNAYSVYNNLEKLGYNPILVFYLPQCVNHINISNKKFYKKYFTFIKRYQNKNEMDELNDKIEIYIAGSDQIFTYAAECYWNYEGIKNDGIKNIFYLSFANLNKNLISFAASYGRNDYYGDYKNRLMTSYDLSRFDHISVREKDAIGLMKEKFNIENAEQVIEIRIYFGL